MKKRSQKKPKKVRPTSTTPVSINDNWDNPLVTGVTRWPQISEEVKAV